MENRPTSTVCFSTNQHQMTMWPSSTPPGGAEQWLDISQQVAAAKCQTQTSFLTPSLSHSADYPRGTTVLCSETWTQINGSCFWEIKADSQAVDLQNKMRLSGECMDANGWLKGSCRSDWNPIQSQTGLITRGQDSRFIFITVNLFGTKL